MDLASPINSVIPGVTGVVLQVLARTYEPLTGSAIAKLTFGQASRAGVNNTLKVLVASGLVTSERAGAANLYRLNRQHLAAGPVISLAELRADLMRRIHDATLAFSFSPVAVWMFGSAARGDGDTTSDIDLILIRPENIAADNPQWTDDIMRLTHDVHMWTGNGCDLLDYTITELLLLARKKNPLIASLHQEALVIVGRSLTDLIGSTR